MSALVSRLAELHAEEKAAKAVVKELTARKRAVAADALSEMLEQGVQRLTVEIGDGEKFTVYLKQVNYPKLKDGKLSSDVGDALGDCEDESLRALLRETYDSRSLAKAMREITERDAIDEYKALFDCVELSTSTEVAVRGA